MSAAKAKLEAGDHVRIVSGIWGGRNGIIANVAGDIHTVQFSAPKLFLDPSGPQENKSLPYLAVELARVDEDAR